ncbi:unnamed protein product [Cunninghamella echinulata]
MGNLVCFVTANFDNDIRVRIKLDNLYFVMKKSTEDEYVHYLESIHYEYNFFIIWDEQTLENHSFLFVDIESRKKFRCDIDSLNEPFNCLINGTCNFEVYCMDKIHVTYRGPPVRYSIKLPRKQLPKRNESLVLFANNNKGGG